MDSQRPHNIGAYGDQRGVTPTLDRLADEGVVFERKYVRVTLVPTIPCFDDDEPLRQYAWR
jgi:arylsulfatase A-like enzyme